MPGFLTDLVNNKILDCFFGGSAIIPPSTLYIGLSLTRSYKGGYVSEPNGGSYARVAVPNDLDHFLAASAGSKSNAKAITFPYVLAMADLHAPRAINGGDPAPAIVVNALFLSHT
jgi:hypothetical protein